MVHPYFKVLNNINNIKFKQMQMQSTKSLSNQRTVSIHWKMTTWIRCSIKNTRRKLFKQKISRISSTDI